MLIALKKWVCYRFKNSSRSREVLLIAAGHDRGFKRVITGFNTDIEHEGVVYHVQTEDKGLDSPIILSLVYAGGAILASKRSPYEDLIREGFSDEALSERLKRQHRLICAAIHTGRINDLKKMSGARDIESTANVGVEETVADRAEDTIQEELPPLELEVGSKRSQEYQPPPPGEAEPQAQESETTQVPERPAIGAYRISKTQPVVVEPTVPVQPTVPLQPTGPLQQGLIVRLLDEVEFYSGDAPTLRVLVTNREGQEENPLSSAAVSVKVLGTAFRPLIYSLKTQRDGIAVVSTQIPEFTSGRAAILVRATAKDAAAEMRCIIHPKS